MRVCSTCQHLKRPEIDRRLAAGEPLAHIAQECGLSGSSLYRHRTNCFGLGSANAIKKEAARGSAAMALLPSKETLAEAYQSLRDRIDGIVTQAQQEGSLRVALAGLGSVRATLDSLARLGAHEPTDKSSTRDRHGCALDLAEIAERLIKQFDREPEIKARIATALLSIDEQTRSSPPGGQTRSQVSSHENGAACVVAPSAGDSRGPQRARSLGTAPADAAAARCAAAWQSPASATPLVGSDREEFNNAKRQ